MKSERLRALLPDVWALMRPRRGLLLIGFFLMVINRLAGLVLPASTKYLIDDVIAKHRHDLLLPLVLAVVGATALQGVTSFSLTQLLSKAAQRLITDLRKQVQAHIGRLPVTFHDSHKTGVLVSRIMSDVEGIRNLIGTGLVEFAGGLLAAVVVMVWLFFISVKMTVVAIVVLLAFSGVLWKAFGSIRPNPGRTPVRPGNWTVAASSRVSGATRVGARSSRPSARRSVSGPSYACAGEPSSVPRSPSGSATACVR